jgi:hypothetical protein
MGSFTPKSQFGEECADPAAVDGIIPPVRTGYNIPENLIDDATKFDSQELIACRQKELGRLCEAAIPDQQPEHVS